MMSQGVLYIGGGQQHYQEACRSVRSLKQHMPQIHVTLFTDQPNPDPIFDCVHPMQRGGHPFREKIAHIARTPYERTLFLDTDTLICHPFAECFDMLDRFDIAFAIEAKHALASLPDVPDSFPEPNTGVLFFKQSPKMQAFLQTWLTMYDSGMAQQRWGNDPGDQNPFRVALYESDLRLATLPQQYHARYLSAGLVAGPVRIMHGRRNDQYYPIEQVAEALNKDTRLRAFVAGQVIVFQYGGRFFGGRKPVYPANFSEPLPVVTLRHVISSIRKRGLSGTLRFIIDRFKRYS